MRSCSGVDSVIWMRGSPERLLSRNKDNTTWIHRSDMALELGTETSGEIRGVSDSGRELGQQFGLKLVTCKVNTFFACADRKNPKLVPS